MLWRFRDFGSETKCRKIRLAPLAQGFGQFSGDAICSKIDGCCGVFAILVPKQNVGKFALPPWRKDLGNFREMRFAQKSMDVVAFSRFWFRNKMSENSPCPLGARIWAIFGRCDLLKNRWMLWRFRDFGSETKCRKIRLAPL